MLKVMLVDDEEWCLEELADIVEGIDNIELMGKFRNASNALEAIEKEVPQVIFIDVQMPEMNGLELARQIRALVGQTHIILISEKEYFALKGFDVGVNDYILKPLRKERIEKALKRVG